MPMGIVNSDEFEREHNNCSIHRTIKPVIDILPSPGRSQGDINVPNSLRKIIGETASIDGRKEALAIAEQFGISPSSVSAYTNGSTSTDSMDKQPNINHINGAKLRVSNRARNRLMKALNALTTDKIAESKAKDIAGIAKDMSVVMKHMEPDSPVDDGESKRPQFVIYAPQIHQENHYDSLYVNE